MNRTMRNRELPPEAAAADANVSISSGDVLQEQGRLRVVLIYISPAEKPLRLLQCSLRTTRQQEHREAVHSFLA